MMFRETDPDWDKELAEDCKIELDKYGNVQFLKVEKESQVRDCIHNKTSTMLKLIQGEVYVKYDTVEAAKRSIDALNGRWFGGRQIYAAFISDAIMQAHQ